MFTIFTRGSRRNLMLILKLLFICCNLFLLNILLFIFNRILLIAGILHHLILIGFRLFIIYVFFTMAFIFSVFIFRWSSAFWKLINLSSRILTEPTVLIADFYWIFDRLEMSWNGRILFSWYFLMIKLFPDGVFIIKIDRVRWVLFFRTFVLLIVFTYFLIEVTLRIKENSIL